MSEISKQIEYICAEKGLDSSIVMEALEAALGAAYRKDFGNRQQNIEVKFDPETGDMQMWDVKQVVEDISEEALEAAQEELLNRREKAQEEGRELTEEDIEDLPRFNAKLELMLTEAKEIKKTAKVGDELRIELEIPRDFGRMAAQTAKQVIIQKLREAERNSVFEDFQNQEGQIVEGVVHRRDKTGNVLVDLGKITGVLEQKEQIPREFYRPGVKLHFYVLSVGMGTRGPEIMLSRSHVDMVKTVFLNEIPEIESGEVEIKGIARDAGFRSKVAVSTDDENIDPIGSCIGQRGSRISTIIEELGGEKIDIIQYSEDPIAFIKQALSPAKIDAVELDEKAEPKAANVIVPEDQFSLAIGRGGQNVRLASELTGWQLNVVQADGAGTNSDDSDDNTTEQTEEEVEAKEENEPEGESTEESAQE